MATSSRILLIRTSSLGDVAQALPVLSALRRSLPDAKIAWLVEAAYAPILQHHPDLDEVIVVRLRHWRRRPFSRTTWREIAAFLTALDRFSPELTLDLMGNHKAGFLAALTLADRRIGLERPYRREPSSVVWMSETVRPAGRHSVDKMLAVLSAVGETPPEVRFDGQKLLAALGLSAPEKAPQRPRVVIHPGAGWANKRYPAASWGQVACLLREANGASIGVVEGLEEDGLADSVVKASDGAANVVRAPELAQLVELLSGAALVLGGDTGPVHLAHALGRPVLCLMGPTDPESCGPYGAPGAAIWRRLPCSFCHKRFPQTMPCLAEIEPAAVAERASRILAGRDLPPAGPIGRGNAGCLGFH